MILVELSDDPDCDEPDLAISRVTYTDRGIGIVNEKKPQELYEKRHLKINAVNTDCYHNGKITVTFDVCVTLSNDSVCCDSVTFEYFCNFGFFGNFPMVAPNPSNGSMIEITVPLLHIPSSPLTITVFDQLGVGLLEVTNAIPIELSPIFHTDISVLPAGNYYIVFQIEEEILAVPFIKQYFYFIIFFIKKNVILQF